MKNVTLIASALLILNSCGDSNSDSNTNQSNNTIETNEETQDFEVSDNASSSSWTIFDGVERYSSTDSPGLSKYEYNDLFDFAFPVEPEFEEVPKEDHTNYQISKVHNGSIYDVTVEDYSNQPGEVDNGYAVFVHDSYVEFMEGQSLHSSEINLSEEVFGIYSVYEYSFNDKDYKVDHITWRKGDYLVHLTLTSRPNFESTVVVSEFFNGFSFK